MSNLLDLAICKTPTTGTGSLTLSSPVFPGQSWLNAGGIDGNTYNYLIRDGDNVELSFGVLSDSGTIITRTLKYSSTSALLNLSGNATVTQVASANDFILPNNLIANTGSSLVGADDGASGALYTTVQGALTFLGYSSEGGDYINLTNRTKQVTMNFPSSLAGYGMYISGSAVAKNLDALQISHAATGVGGTGYGLHILSSGDANNAGGGGLGVATDTPGLAYCGVFNRRTSGTGAAIQARTWEAMNGPAIEALSTSTGAQSDAIYAYKTLSDLASDPLAWALNALNDSTNGGGIQSITTANNAYPFSNLFERRNVNGIVTQDRVIVGGARTGILTGHDILIQPETAITGAFPITGCNITLTANVTGSNSASGVQIANSATSGTASYGVQAVVLGTNAANYAIYGSATGATTNWAGYFVQNVYIGGVPSAPNLATYANDAAAGVGGLTSGQFYKTATGQLMVKL